MLLGLRQMPFKLGRKNSEYQDRRKAQRDRQIDIKSVQYRTNDRAYYARACIEMFDKDHGNIAGTDIPYYASANSRDHTQKYLKEYVIEGGPCRYADHGKRSQTY